jgi:hypothetical protein
MNLGEIPKRVGEIVPAVVGKRYSLLGKLTSPKSIPAFEPEHARV